jgi:hypothetical protein
LVGVGVGVKVGVGVGGTGVLVGVTVGVGVIVGVGVGGTGVLVGVTVGVGVIVEVGVGVGVFVGDIGVQAPFGVKSIVGGDAKQFAEVSPGLIVSNPVPPPQRSTLPL